jgi:uncharacterized protein DUF2846
MRTLQVLVFGIFLIGLLANAQEPVAQAGADSASSKATLYLYRYKQFVGSALSPSIYCDEAELARMENGRYFAVKLDPGKHSFRSNDKQSGVDLDMKAGQSYFMRVEIATGFMKGHGRLILMAAEQAGYELKKLKPLDDGKVVDKAKVSIAEANLDAPATTFKPAATVEQPKPAANPEPATTEANSNNAKATLTPVSQPTGEISLAEAARQAKQKKQNPPQQ